MEQAEIHSVFEIVAPLPGSDAGRNRNDPAPKGSARDRESHVTGVASAF
jgi:hypothetical protein